MEYNDAIIIFRRLPVFQIFAMIMFAVLFFCAGVNEYGTWTRIGLISMGLLLIFITGGRLMRYIQRRSIPILILDHSFLTYNICNFLDGEDNEGKILWTDIKEVSFGSKGWGRRKRETLDIITINSQMIQIYLTDIAASPHKLRESFEKYTSVKLSRFWLFLMGPKIDIS